MPSIKPPDYRAAQGIQGFTEGLQSGLNIVQDVGRIKALKGENERRDIQTKRDAAADARRKVTEGREDEEYGQRQEDRANSKRDEIVAKQEKFMTGYARAIRNDPAIATDIRNMMFTAIGNPKRVTATEARDVDGGFEIVETYQDGSSKTIDAAYVKQAFNGFPRPRGESVDGEDGDGDALKLYNAVQKELERVQRKIEAGAGTEKDKQNLSALEARAQELGVKAGVLKEQAPPEERPVDKATGVPLRPSQMPGARQRMADNARAGYPKGGIPASAPTTAPAATPAQAPAAAAQPAVGTVAMTNPSNGKTFHIRAGSVDKYKALGYTIQGQ